MFYIFSIKRKYARLSSYIHIGTYTHAYIDTYIHPYIDTYIHAYVHAYIHTYIHACRWFEIGLPKL